MASQIPWMNHAIWVHETNDSYARVLQACYGGEIVSIDVCLRLILDEVDARDAADNTRIFFRFMKVPGRSLGLSKEMLMRIFENKIYPDDVDRIIAM